jgi:hypothetical protein
MSGERKVRVGLWITAVLIGVPVLYGASFGPACWLVARNHLSSRLVGATYWPVLWIYGSSTNRLTRAISSYARLGLRDFDCVSLPFHRPSGECIYWQFIGSDSQLDDRGIKASVEVIQETADDRYVTNRDIVEMAENGVSDGVICTVIRTQGGKFDTSPDAIDALREAGVSDVVIEAIEKSAKEQFGDP